MVYTKQQRAVVNNYLWFLLAIFLSPNKIEALDDMFVHRIELSNKMQYMEWNIFEVWGRRMCLIYCVLCGVIQFRIRSTTIETVW